MKHKKLTQDRVVYFINYVMLAVFLIIVLYPLIYIISCSFSSGDALMSGKVKLFPVEPTLQSYRAVFKYKSIWTGYWNSIVYTLVGTVISMVLTLFAAYPLSRSDFRGKKVFTVILLFTMMFSGGLIPTYLLVKSLHMLNTIWAVVLPGAVSAYNVIVARTFFANTIPKELQEAAEMDGCVYTDYCSVVPVGDSRSLEFLFLAYDLSGFPGTSSTAAGIKKNFTVIPD